MHAVQLEQADILRRTDIALKQIDASAHAAEAKRREINEAQVRAHQRPNTYGHRPPQHPTPRAQCSFETICPGSIHYSFVQSLTRTRTAHIDGLFSRNHF